MAMVHVDHNYRGQDNLRVLDPNGKGIAGVTIEVYPREEGGVCGATTTDAEGCWVSPVLLFPGEYDVVFSKARQFERHVVPLKVEG